MANVSAQIDATLPARRLASSAGSSAGPGGAHLRRRTGCAAGPAVFGISGEIHARCTALFVTGRAARGPTRSPGRKCLRPSRTAPERAEGQNGKAPGRTPRPRDSGDRAARFLGSRLGRVRMGLQELVVHPCSLTVEVLPRAKTEAQTFGSVGEWPNLLVSVGRISRRRPLSNSEKRARGTDLRVSGLESWRLRRRTRAP